MKRAVAVTALALLCSALPARAEFRDLVRQIERRANVHHKWIPFLSVARMAARMHPDDGVSDLHLAVFGKNRLTAADLDALVRASADGWSPIIKMSSRQEGAQSMIYAREIADELEMLIVTRERDEMAIVQVRLEPSAFLDALESPGAGIRF